MADATTVTKKWYQSKTVWAGIIAVIVAVYNAVSAALLANFSIHLPILPDWIFALLGAFGIYGRVSATTTIQQ